MCYSGCEFEVMGLGERAGECRKPRYLRCPLDEDYDEEENERILDEKEEAEMSRYGEHLFELCRTIQETQR